MSHKTKRLSVVTWLVLAAGAIGCGDKSEGPDLGELYNRSAQHHGPRRNPVIVIPGILGSKLVDGRDGTVVWGAFAGDYADPSTPRGARLGALPMSRGAALRDLRDDVVPNGALDRIRIDVLGLPIKLNAYANILGTLGAGGYRDQQLAEAGAVNYGADHFTCFQFAYDWRRDNVENAQQLHRFILARKRYIADEMRKRFGIENPRIKFDLVAHSMGGLVARYYLRYGGADLPADGSAPKITWAGAEHVARAVLVGTPSAGAVETLDRLVNGSIFAPIVPKYEAAISGTYPSMYQLLPRGRHGPVVDAETDKPIADLYDPELWERMRWGLASPEQDRVLKVLLPDESDAAQRRQIALDHQQKCLRRAERFAAALDAPAKPPAGLSLMLFAGDREPTSAVAAADGATGEVKMVRWQPGDGTVLRSSALMDERLDGNWAPSLRSPIAWRQVTFLFTDHLGMTKDAAFSDNVLYILLESPR